MAKQKIVERVKHIAYSNIKIGQFVQLEDKSLYVVVHHGQMYHLIPIDMSKTLHVNMYGINNPKIINVFSAKNGDCLVTLDNKEVKENE